MILGPINIRSYLFYLLTTSLLQCNLVLVKKGGGDTNITNCKYKFNGIEEIIVKMIIVNWLHLNIPVNKYLLFYADLDCKISAIV